MKKYDWSPGTRYGKLTIDSELIYKTLSGGRRVPYAWCKCDCGNRKLISIPSLRTYPGGRSTISCGCYYRTSRRRTTTHGESKTRLYAIYKGILSRCHNKRRKSYLYYGGKGVLVCAEWRGDYMAFKKWAEATGYNDTLTIDRKDSRGDYSPCNCRWVTTSQNTAHRNAKYLTVEGETKRLGEWAEDSRCTVHRSTLRRRLAKGMTAEEAIKKPHVKHTGLKHHNALHVVAFGETKSLREWVDDARCVVSYATLQIRLGDGWKPETAITLRLRKPKIHHP